MTRAPYTTAPDVVFPLAQHDAEDPRFAQRLTTWEGGDAHLLLLGTPFDQGVTLGGGRAGARGGPAALRRALARFGTLYDMEHQVDFGALRCCDAGDVDPSGASIAEYHDRVSAAAEYLLGGTQALVTMGGGNDVSFATIRALKRHYGTVGGVNIDAHLDVRPVREGRITSGTPYRRVLDELGVSGAAFAELGQHSAVNARAHLEWLLARGARCHPLTSLRRSGPAEVLRRELLQVKSLANAMFVSIDLDVFAAAFAPGVSAPGTEGLTPEEGRELAFAAGADPRVRLFELMELNPEFDVDARTARLAALLLCAFAAGVATRAT